MKHKLIDCFTDEYQNNVIRAWIEALKVEESNDIVDYSMNTGDEI